MNEEEKIEGVKEEVVETPVEQEQEGSTPNWDLYNTYKYTFKLINGEYYFQTLELVK